MEKERFMRNNAKGTALGLCIVAGALAMTEPASAEVFWNLKAEKQTPSKAICMGIAGGANGSEVNDGAKLVVWDCNSADDQKWSRTPDTYFGNFFGNGNVLVENLATINGSPACITDSSNGTSTGDKGVQLAMRVCSQSNLSQQFTFIDMHVNDSAGYPCYTIVNDSLYRYVGVANAQANPVQRGMAVVMWDRTSSDDQVWCVHPNPPPIVVH
jgi:hypothetical protein